MTLWFQQGKNDTNIFLLVVLRELTFSDLRVKQRKKDMIWCVKIPDFMWLKHFYLEDHDQSLLNMDIYAQFSMFVVVSSMEPVYLAPSQ